MKQLYRLKVWILLLPCLYSLCFSSNISAFNKGPKKVPKKNDIETLGIITGPNTGTYYKMAQEMRMIKSFDLKIYDSAGSMENIKRLIIDENINFAIVQSDVIPFAEQLMKKKIGKIKKVFDFYNEEIHLLVLDKSKIRALKDLENKRVNVGLLGGGTRISSRLISNLTGIKWQEFNYPINESLVLLEKKKIDAAFFVIGSPGKIFNALKKKTTKMRFVDITHKGLDKLYDRTVIRKNIYFNQKKEINTYSIKSVLVARYDKNKIEAIKSFILKLVHHLPDLKKFGHPKWLEVNPTLP